MRQIDNSDKIILDLCGGTGSWSRPYKEAGYDVRVITLPDNDVRNYTPPRNVYGILAAPPCTEFSPFNQFLGKYKTPNLSGGMEIVDACFRIIRECNCRFWALENPRGTLRKYLGSPTLTFEPWWYGDAWTKPTDIWGNFTIPERNFLRWDDVEPKLNLYIRPNRTKPSISFQHKSMWKNVPQLSFHEPQTDAEFRAMTPPGFAQAFFKANQ